jgi:hypothetical protein
MARPAAAVVLALAGALGCGENVLVSSWELALKTSDAGVAPEEIEPPAHGKNGDGGRVPNYSAIAAQNARKAALKNESKEHDARSSSESDKSNH